MLRSHLIKQEPSFDNTCSKSKIYTCTRSSSLSIDLVSFFQLGAGIYTLGAILTPRALGHLNISFVIMQFLLKRKKILFDWEYGPIGHELLGINC